VSDGWAPAAAAAVVIAALLSLGPVPELELLLQGFAVGSAVGTLVAYRSRRKGWHHDLLSLQVRYGILFAVGVVTLVVVLEAVRS